MPRTPVTMVVYVLGPHQNHVTVRLAGRELTVEVVSVSVCLSVCPCLHPSFCLSVCPSVSVCLYKPCDCPAGWSITSCRGGECVCLSVCPSVCPCLHPSFCLSVCPSVSVCLYKPCDCPAGWSIPSCRGG